MTFKHLIMAFKSSYGLVGVIGTLMSFAAGFGLSRYFEYMPGWVSGLCVVVAYLAGYIVACYQLETIRIEADSENPNAAESTVTLADHEGAIKERDEEIARLRSELERRDRFDGEQYMRDLMDDYGESGLDDVDHVPYSSIRDSIMTGIDRMHRDRRK